MSAALPLRITVLGTGAMGGRMAQRLLAAGHAVTVWNRTPAATEPLVKAGARAARTPRDAVVSADVVIAMLRDDGASRSVWLDAADGALQAMSSGAVAIECSTLSLLWARELATAAGARGVALLDAPVSGSRPQADAGQLVFLVGGEAAVLEQVRPVLAQLGAAVSHVGSSGQGALAKLATNALLGVQVAALAELIPLLERQGANMPVLLQALARTSAWAPVGGYLSGSMLAGDYQPQFPVSLIEKDFGYIEQAAGSASATPLLAAVRSVFQHGLQQGLGEQNMTAVRQLYPAA